MDLNGMHRQPAEWQTKRLDEITNTQKPISYGIVQTGKPVHNGVKCIRVVDIKSGRVNPEDLITTSEEISTAYKRTILSTGDLVIALRGKIGELALIEPALAGSNLTRGVALISPTDEVDSEYLLHYLSSAESRRVFEKNLNGSALQEIPIAALRAITAAIPSKAEQRAIASALSDMDALLAKLDQLITKKRDIKQAAMQEFFEKPAQKWMPRKLADISAFITKGSTPTTYGFNWETSGVLFLRSECVSDAGIDLTQSMYISPEAHAVLKRSEVLQGDLLMTITGNVGRVVQATPECDGSNINQHIARIRINDPQTDSRFVYHQLSQRRIRKDFEKITTGQAYPQLSLAQVRDCKIPMPGLPEQNRIAGVLSDMDTEITALEARREKTRLIKQGMMQALLTGRVRLV